MKYEQMMGIEIENKDKKKSFVEILFDLHQSYMQTITIIHINSTHTTLLPKYGVLLYRVNTLLHSNTYEYC